MSNFQLPTSFYPHFPERPEGFEAGFDAGWVAVGGVAAGSLSVFVAAGSLDWYCRSEALTLNVPAEIQSVAAPFIEKVPKV